MPPHTYRLQQRIHLAKRMLADGIPIVQAALDTGFTDQSHFTRRFKTFVGTTPLQYQMGVFQTSWEDGGWGGGRPPPPPPPPLYN
jgi:AraC-like DNA-binding protein